MQSLAKQRTFPLLVLGSPRPSNMPGPAASSSECVGNLTLGHRRRVQELQGSVSDGLHCAKPAAAAPTANGATFPNSSKWLCCSKNCIKILLVVPLGASPLYREAALRQASWRYTGSLVGSFRTRQLYLRLVMQPKGSAMLHFL